MVTQRHGDWQSEGRPDTYEQQADPLLYLVEAAQQPGDDEASQRRRHLAFTELVRVTYADTYALAWKLLGNPRDAEDVAQITYMHAYRSLPGFEAKSKFSSWLFRIAANAANDYITARGKHDHGQIPDTLEHPRSRYTHPESALQHMITVDTLTTSLEGLDAKYRDVLILYEAHGLSHEQIAARLGIRVGLSKLRLHRARRKLRDNRPQE
jgi:RNA polymerase sigma-70 factor (ECF subfamily)